MSTIPAEIIAKLHALGLNDISGVVDGAITRERLGWIGTVGSLKRERDDLLAALENLLFNAMSLPRSNVAGCINVDRNDVERARDAIAKAKGTP